MSYRDKTLPCSDCTRLFTFSAEDQGLSAELGYVPPVRCGICRNSREASRRRSGRIISTSPVAVPADLPL